MTKEHDYFLELMSNPTFGPKDFLLVGLDSGNTGMLDKSVYKKALAIQDSELFKTDGKFDEKKFDLAYEQALQQYNDLTRLSLENKPFFRDDIFAPSTLKSKEPEFSILKVANPLRQQESFVNFGVKEAPTMSLREIAQSNPVYDFETGKWVDSPNDNWIDNFLNPKVLALWDFDADKDGKPTDDPSKVVFHKGEKKINPVTGTYYYETLGNRDVYGRDVLSGFDTLTVDGSAWNKFDFFDSDDREKSTFGSLSRAVAQIAPVFIPYVGEYYIASRIGLSLTLLLPTIGKVFTGSDNKFLSRLEGINQAFSFSTSDRTQGSEEAGIAPNPWTMETGLKLISDVFTQLAEQRWVFKYGTSLFSGVTPKAIGETEAAVATREKLVLDMAKKSGFNLEALKTAKTKEELDTIMKTELAVNYLRAKSNFDKSIKAGQELASKASMAYMTGITTADSYGEAKQQGASDLEAALFALGYTFGEYKLISSDLGLWILPELKILKFLNRQIAKELARITREVQKEGGTTNLVNEKLWKRIFNFGKTIATLDYSDSILANTSKMTMSAMLGEGVEETSEELLLDVSRTLFNMAATATGSDTRLDAWKDIATRYGMSFIGGTVGGGIATGLPGYRAARDAARKPIKNDSDAYRQLVHLVLNGQADEFIDTVKKMDIGGNKDLSMEEVKNSDGTISYRPAKNYEDSQDYAIKLRLIELVQMIDNILQEEGAKVSDDSLLNDKLIRKDLRYHALLGSNILGVYTNEFNNVISELADISLEVKSLENSKNGNGASENETDGLKKEDKLEFSLSDLNRLDELKLKQKELRTKLELYKDGTMANEFIGEALFEMETHISSTYSPDFKTWAEIQSGKLYSQLSDSEKTLLSQQWKDESISRRNQIHKAYLVFKLNQEALSDLILEHNDKYFTDKGNNIFRNLEEIFLGNSSEKPSLEESIIRSENPVDIASEMLPSGTRLIILKGLLDSLDGEISEDELKLIRESFNALDLTFEESIGIEKFPTSFEEYNNLSLEEKDKIKAAFDISGEITDDKQLAWLIKDRTEQFNAQKFENAKRVWESFLSNKEVLKALIKKLKEAKYLTPTTKQYLKDFVNGNNLDSKVVEELNKAIDEVSISPIEELLTNMKLSLASKGIDTTGMITDLAKFMNDLAKSYNIDNFSYSDEIDYNILRTLDLIEIAHSHIEAAKSIIRGDIGQVFGYNAAINLLHEKYPIEGHPHKKLVLIDSNVANSLLHELAKIYTDLKFYQTIYNANTNSKLTDHIKTDLKVNTLYFGNLKKWSVLIPDDWEGKNKVIEAINNATTILKIIENGQEEVSDKEQEIIFKERLNIESAVYEFFNSNEDKLKDIEKAKNLFGTLDFTSSLLTILNSGTTALTDRDFMWYLASLAAENPLSVIKEYREAISGNYAPIIALEEAIRRAYSYILNPKTFEQFGDIYNEIYKLQIAQKRAEEGIADTSLDTDEFLLSKRHFLIEGIPGSGKSTATYTTLYKMLDTNHPQLVEKVWFVSNSSKNAADTAKNIGIKNVVTMSKRDYFEKIANNYSLTYDIYGNIQIEENDLSQHEDGFYYYKNTTVNDGVEAPLLVFFDEISSFSQQDLFLSEEFLAKNGIYALGAGDFDQIGAGGRLDLSENSHLYFRLANSNFMSSWKLGTTLRSNNAYKLKNVSSLRESIKDFNEKLCDYLLDDETRLHKEESHVDFAYYEGKEGLFGDKVVNEWDEKDWLSSIINMLDTLKEGEVLNYIYDDPSTDLYVELLKINESGKYAGKINPISAGASLGLEGQYYVIELTNSFNSAVSAAREDDKDNQSSLAFAKTIYTAISRAKQGSLIVGNYTGGERLFEDSFFRSTKQDTISVVNLSNAIKEGFAKRRKEILGFDLVNDAKETKYVRDEKPVTNVDVGPPDDEDDDKEVPTDDDITQEEVTINNIDEDLVIENDKDGELNILVHSFLCLETGCDVIGSKEPTDPAAKLKLGRYFDKRIDNLNGLAQIEKRSNNKISLGSEVKVESDGTISSGKDELLMTLNRIRNICCYGTDKSQIVSEIKRILGTSEDLQIDFIYKNLYRDYDDESETIRYYDTHPNDLKFYKGKDEYETGIFNKNNVNDEIREPKDLVFGVIISLKDGTLLIEIPLAKMTSPLTLLNVKLFSAIRQIFDSVGLDITKFKSEIKKRLLNNDSTPHLKEYAMLLDLYVHSAFNTISYLNDNFTMGKSMKPTGITSTSSERGADYFETLEYYYDGEWVSFDEYKRRMPWRRMTKVFASVERNRTTITVNGHEISVGKPFILVSDYYSDNISDLKMLELYIKLLEENRPPLIRLVYITPPESSIEEYIFNLNNALSKHKNNTENVDKDLGNKITAFRLLQKALVDKSDFMNTFTEWVNESSYANKLDLISRVETIKELVKTLGDYERKNGRKELYKLINTPIKNLDRSLQEALSFTREDGKTGWIMPSNSDLTLRHVFLMELHKMLLSTTLYNDSFSSSIIKKNESDIEFPEKARKKITSFIELVKKGGYTGVLYHLKLKHDSSVSVNIGSESFTFSEIDTDIDNDYSISLKPFMINGKLDSTSYVVNIVPLAEWILKGGLGRDTNTIDKTNSSNIFEVTDDALNIKRKNYGRYIGTKKKTPNPINTDVDTFKVKISAMLVKGGNKSSVLKKLVEEFGKLKSNEQKRVLADPRAFIFEKTGLIYYNNLLTNFGKDIRVAGYIPDGTIIVKQEGKPNLYYTNVKGDKVELLEADIYYIDENKRYLDKNSLLEYYIMLCKKEIDHINTLFELNDFLNEIKRNKDLEKLLTQDFIKAEDRILKEYEIKLGSISTLDEFNNYKSTESVQRDLLLNENLRNLFNSIETSLLEGTHIPNITLDNILDDNSNGTLSREQYNNLLDQLNADTVISLKWGILDSNNKILINTDDRRKIAYSMIYSPRKYREKLEKGETLIELNDSIIDSIISDINKTLTKDNYSCGFYSAPF